MSIMSKTKPKSKFDIAMGDFKLFAKNFVKIIDNNGTLVPFILNDEQEDFLNNMSKFNLIVKSRQLGMSTFSIAYCVWMACRNPNTNYMIVSLSNDSATSLFNMLKRMVDELPRDKYPGKFPSVVRDNKGELTLDNNTRITIASAQGKAGMIGRGSTYRYILLSEIAHYDNDQQRQVLTSLEQALAKTPESRLVCESTANGINKYWEMYKAAEKGHSSYKAFFYGYLSKGHTKQFKYEIDSAVEWYKGINQGQRLSEKDLSQGEKELFDKGASLNLLMWRTWKLASMKEEDFNQEFPHSANVAFRTSGSSVFSSSKIVDRMENAIPELSKLELQEELPDTLYPLLGTGLRVFYPVKRNEKFFIGADISSGVGADYSSICVFDSELRQVCAYSSNKIRPYEIADIIEAIGLYYNYGMVCIETNNVGITVVERMRREKGYLNLYRHYTFDKFGQRKSKIGFNTNRTTKPILIEDFVEVFEQGYCLIHDKQTLDEMAIFVKKGETYGNIGGNGKNHDDSVIAACLAYQAFKCKKWYVNN